jgi:hypothetical protein
MFKQTWKAWMVVCVLSQVCNAITTLAPSMSFSPTGYLTTQPPPTAFSGYEETLSKRLRQRQNRIIRMASKLHQLSLECRCGAAILALIISTVRLHIRVSPCDSFHLTDFDQVLHVVALPMAFPMTIIIAALSLSHSLGNESFSSR